MDTTTLKAQEEQEIEQDIIEDNKLLQSTDTTSYIKMDFTLQTPEQRNEKVKEIIDNTPSEKLTSTYLEKLSDYIIYAMDKQERKQKKIITENRKVTIDKRERSFEGLAGQLENGEDGIYGMMTEDKNIIFAPKISITQEDIDTVPGLKALKEEITKLEDQIKMSSGRRCFLLKKQLIEMRQDQYVLKNSFKKPIYSINLIKTLCHLDLSEEIGLDEKNEPYSIGIISLFNPKHISLLLCNYSRLKQDSYTDFLGDVKWLMMDLDNLIEKSIETKYPVYLEIIIRKIDKMPNKEIKDILYDKYGVEHTVEYISNLWRNKIPKLIAQQAKEDWLIFHYTQEEKGYWKKCSCCGQIKLGHQYFFSRNNTSKDQWYSICKECRSKKAKEKKMRLVSNG